MQAIRTIDGLYHLDPAHSAIGFTVRHAGLSRIRGTFDSFHGHAVIDAGDVDASALMVSIAAGSINTMMPARDEHLRAGDFFDVAQYPTMTFVGIGFEVLDDTHVRVIGDLTIKQATRRLVIDFAYTGSSTDPFGNERIGFEGATSISRKDFGITWNAALDNGGWMISDEVQVEIEASAVKQARPGAGQEEAVLMAVAADAAVAEKANPSRAAADPDEQAVPGRRAALVVEPDDSTGGAGAGAPADGADADPGLRPRRGAAEESEAPVVPSRPERQADELLVDPAPVGPTGQGSVDEGPRHAPVEDPAVEEGGAQGDRRSWRRIFGGR